MIFIHLLNWIKQSYCGLIYGHDQIVAYEINDNGLECCGRCGKVWMQGDDSVDFT